MYFGAVRLAKVTTRLIYTRALSMATGINYNSGLYIIIFLINPFR